MDWSKAKTILIVAFLALNLFLAYQLLQARGEQSETRNLAENTRRDLEQLARDKQVTIVPEVPERIPRVTFLEARTTSPDKKWKPENDGSFVRKFEPPLNVENQGLDEVLGRVVQHFQDYEYFPEDSDANRKIYYQVWNDHLLFDSRLEVRQKGNRITSIRQVHFDIEENDQTVQQGITAHQALFSLIEGGHIRKGDTVVHVELGYHGQSYDAELRVLPPVWRIQTDRRMFYVNALTGSIESASLPGGKQPSGE